MLLVLVPGRFSDAAVAVDVPDDAMFRTARLSRAVALRVVFTLPLGV